MPVGQQDEEQLGLVGIEADEAQLVADQKVEAGQLSLQPVRRNPTAFLSASALRSANPPLLLAPRHLLPPLSKPPAASDR